MAILEKLFSKIIFKDYPDTSTPLDASNMNALSNAIDGIDDRVVELNSNLGSLFTGEHLSGEVNLDVIYTNMRTNSMKLVQLGNVTGGTGLPSAYYSYSIVFMIKGVSNYGMMIMLSLNNTSIMFTKLVTSSNGSGNWMRTTRTTDA